MTGTKRTAIILTVVALLLLGVVIGFVIGKKQGESVGQKSVEEKLNPILNIAFPKPPEELLSLDGTIKNIYGATLTLEVNDPDDYLPHPDNSPRKKETRFASLTSATQILLKDFSKIDAQGNPKTTVLKPSDLKVGNAVTVRSAQNIRDAQKFDVTSVEIVKY